MLLSFLNSFASTNSIYKKEVKAKLGQQQPIFQPISEEDLKNVPTAVANYIRYCGWIGKPRPENFRIAFQGDFSLKEGKFIRVKSEQYNFVRKPARIFHIGNWMFSGRHHYDEKGAFMLIKLLGRFKIANVGGSEMNQSELVTFFNDMCILAPGVLPFQQIEWETMDDKTVKGTITQFGNTISATLTFNDNFELVNFVSSDRFATDTKGNSEKIPWSTPMKADYIELDGIKVPEYGEAIWHYPDRDFCYAKLWVKEVEYNLAQFK